MIKKISIMTINTIGHKERSQKHLKMKGIIIQNPIIKILNNLKKIGIYYLSGDFKTRSKEKKM